MFPMNAEIDFHITKFVLVIHGRYAVMVVTVRTFTS